MPEQCDGPGTSLFQPLRLNGGTTTADLRTIGLSEEMTEALPFVPTGDCVCRGIRFSIERVIVVKEAPVRIDVEPFNAGWIVFMHVSDVVPHEANADGFFSPMRGTGALNDHAATYIMEYKDGSEATVQVRRRHQIGAFQRAWGENCFQAVSHLKPRPVRQHHEQPNPDWGHSQTRASERDGGTWINWLWAWENPHPEKTITGFTFAPGAGTVLVSAASFGNVSSNPLRWNQRSKALVDLAKILSPNETFDPVLDENGLLKQIRIDMGQVISAVPQSEYPDKDWQSTYNNKNPAVLPDKILVEYTAHDDAMFHLWDGSRVPVLSIDADSGGSVLKVPAAERSVTLKIVEKGTGTPVPVKLHIHGQFGEYLAPADRHRIPNDAWFEDYGTDFVHQPTGSRIDSGGRPLGAHYCTYIPGEVQIELPLGEVFIEISKGYEIKPVRTIVDISSKTEIITIEIEKMLHWRRKGWVSADTHVHFLSPATAMLEGSAEGVNIINLLASQWGELMTNVGDFDGKTTWGSKEAGGKGEYLVRVGTENRQHVLGHISLLGYEGNIISPMTTGGPDESALGDPIKILLSEWARQCKSQKGVVIIPHFPNPRAEHAATIVDGGADGVEMTSWGDLYSGISPYSLSDWYRYLNCGYPVAAVGGTDKMSAATAVGTVRTYAQIGPEEEFSYETWKEAIRTMRTFVTYGPLIEFTVDGHPAGDRISMTSSGGTVEVQWTAASVTVPMTAVELVVNGEIRERTGLEADQADGILEQAGSGSWSVSIDRSTWIAILVRGRYSDKPEIIAAHSSAVFVDVEGTGFFSAADASTILDQIEGALAFVETIGTRAEAKEYKRMMSILLSAHRKLHNRMHRDGVFHDHTPTTHHAEHEEK